MDAFGIVMTSHTTRKSSLPDYYGDERRALIRVRLRKVRWIGLAIAGVSLLLWHTGR
jgi:hypothetical protein